MRTSAHRVKRLGRLRLIALTAVMMLSPTFVGTAAAHRLSRVQALTLFQANQRLPETRLPASHAWLLPQILRRRVTPLATADGPQIASVGYTPSSVDVSTSSKTVTFTMHVTDSRNVTNVFADFSNGSEIVSGYMQLISGTAQDGVWQHTYTIPKAQRLATGTTAERCSTASPPCSTTATATKTSPEHPAPSSSPTAIR